MGRASKNDLAILLQAIERGDYVPGVEYQLPTVCRDLGLNQRRLLTQCRAYGGRLPLVFYPGEFMYRGRRLPVWIIRVRKGVQS